MPLREGGKLVPDQRRCLLCSPAEATVLGCTARVGDSQTSSCSLGACAPSAPWATTQFSRHRREYHTIHSKKVTHFGSTSQKTPGHPGELLSAVRHQLVGRQGQRVVRRAGGGEDSSSLDSFSALLCSFTPHPRGNRAEGLGEGCDPPAVQTVHMVIFPRAAHSQTAAADH